MLDMRLVSFSNIDNKVILITGCTGGIGSNLVKKLARYNCKIVLHYHSSDNIADNLYNEIIEYNQNILKLKADITNEEDVQNLIGAIDQKWGKIDILINNAAIYDDKSSWKMDLAAWDSVIRTNLTGAFLVSKYVIPHMKRHNWGRIVNISSIVGSLAVFGTSNYSASKSGLEGLTRSLAIELVKKNITVNTLSLGYFDYGMFKKLRKELQDQIITQIPIKRVGKIEELLHPILFFASEGSSYVTGQTLYVDGGISISGLI